MSRTTLPVLPSVTAVEAHGLGETMASNMKDCMAAAVICPDTRLAAVMGSLGGVNAAGSVVARAIAKKPNLTGTQIVALIMAYQARIAVAVQTKLQDADLAATEPQGRA